MSTPTCMDGPPSGNGEKSAHIERKVQHGEEARAGEGEPLGMGPSAAGTARDDQRLEGGQRASEGTAGAGLLRESDRAESDAAPPLTTARRGANWTPPPDGVRCFEGALDEGSPEETCLHCGKHISRHYGGTEYRCDPAAAPPPQDGGAPPPEPCGALPNKDALTVKPCELPKGHDPADLHASGAYAWRTFGDDFVSLPAPREWVFDRHLADKIVRHVLRDYHGDATFAKSVAGVERLLGAMRYQEKKGGGAGPLGGAAVPRLTPEQIDACQSIGRDEDARRATIGLTELDALCETAREVASLREALAAEQWTAKGRLDAALEALAAMKERAERAETELAALRGQS